MKRLDRQNEFFEELIAAKEIGLYGWNPDLKSEVVAEVVEDLESLEEERAMVGKCNSDELMV